MRRKPRSGVLLMAMIVVILAIGFGRQWLQIASSEDSARDQIHVNLTIDRGKIQSDTQEAADKTRAEASRLSEQVKKSASEFNDRIHPKTANR